MLKPLLIYTAGRIAIFAVLLALLWSLNLGSFPGILFALLLSMPAAYFLLGRQREDLASAMIERRESQAAVRARMRGDRISAEVDAENESAEAVSDRQTERKQDPQ